MTIVDTEALAKRLMDAAEEALTGAREVLQTREEDPEDPHYPPRALGYRSYLPGQYWGHHCPYPYEGGAFIAERAAYRDGWYAAHHDAQHRYAQMCSSIDDVMAARHELEDRLNPKTVALIKVLVEAIVDERLAKVVKP